MPVSNPPTLSSVIAEFGSGGSPNNLMAYVRGGAYVPTNATTTNISTTAVGLALSQFAGATKNVGPVVSLADQFVSDFQPEGSFMSSCSFTLQNDGQAIGSNQLGSEFLENWLDSGTASQVDVYATYSGTGLVGSLNTWMNLGTTQGWTLSTSGIQRSGTLVVTFRNASTLAQLDTANIFMEVSIGDPV